MQDTTTHESHIEMKIDGHKHVCLLNTSCDVTIIPCDITKAGKLYSTLSVKYEPQMEVPFQSWE